MERITNVTFIDNLVAKPKRIEVIVRNKRTRRYTFFPETMEIEYNGERLYIREIDESLSYKLKLYRAIDYYKSK